LARLSYAPGVEGTEIHRIMSHISEPRSRWRELDASLRSSSVIDPGMKEAVRAALATGSGCEFCASVGEVRDFAVEPPDVRLSLATTYALMLRNASEVDESLIRVLQEEFSDAEIVELTCWALFVIAAQGFGAVMDVKAATESEKAAYQASLAAQPQAATDVRRT